MSKFCNLLSSLSFALPFLVHILEYLFTLSLDEICSPQRGERSSSEERLGENHISCLLAFGRRSDYQLGSFCKSINRELEGGWHLTSPDLKLSAPPAHHLQERSSECNSPFILMTLFYSCRNWRPWIWSNVPKVTEWVSVVPNQRPHSQLSFSFFLSQAWVCDKEEFQ